MKIEIVCPICKKAGINKKLLEAEDTASGIIYPYCKSHKGSVKIDLCKVQSASKKIDN